MSYGPRSWFQVDTPREKVKMVNRWPNQAIRSSESDSQDVVEKKPLEEVLTSPSNLEEWDVQRSTLNAGKKVPRAQRATLRPWKGLKKA